MNKTFDFYFDFISPYSYIAHKEIRKLEKKNSIRIRYKPILLGGLHSLNSITAPAFIPSKAKFMIRDCKMIAEKNKIVFKFNSYFPIKTLNLMRGVIIAEEDDMQNFYVDKMFDAIWKDGLNFNDHNIIEKVIKNMNINPKTFFLRSTTPNVKNLLKEKTDDAFKKGIFGAPTFYINNKVFWGQDRLEFAIIEASK
jgi:2-hydroxychromene-2-carboxylate isomerase